MNNLISHSFYTPSFFMKRGSTYFERIAQISSMNQVLFSPMDPGEVKLLELIHSGSYDSILINFKNKKMKALELKKTIDVKKKIKDVLREASYQDIIIKKHNGKVTRIENTEKIFLDR